MDATPCNDSGGHDQSELLNGDVGMQGDDGLPPLEITEVQLPDNGLTVLTAISLTSTIIADPISMPKNACLSRKLTKQGRRSSVCEEWQRITGLPTPLDNHPAFKTNGIELNLDEYNNLSRASSPPIPS